MLIHVLQIRDEKSLEKSTKPAASCQDRLMPPKGSKRTHAKDYDQDVTVVTTAKRMRTTRMVDDRGVSVSTKLSPTKPYLRFDQPPPGRSTNTSRVSEPEKKKDATPERQSVEDLFKEDLSRRMKLLGEYSARLKQAENLMLAREYDICVTVPCGCGNGKLRLARCFECDARPAVCVDCWVTEHRHNPLHWAYVWSDAGYFVKHNISALGYTIPMGHRGDQCPYPTDPLYLIIADTNGVHATRVTYCGCKDGEQFDKWTRLFMHDLFPSTVTNPQSAFTFRLLRHYSSIRRLTDNVFTGNVPDLYKQFMIIVRLWDLLSVERRSGAHHDVLQKPNDLVVECPACPTVGVNMEPGWTEAPPDLRHLHQTRLTLDGNYQANHFAKKNIDKNDVSLWAGRGYLPVASVYNAHCGLEEASTTEKSVCGHLNTINKQNKTKFKNMDISGIVNCQCCHIFVRSSANLKCGERWVSVDECLSRGIGQRSVEEEGIIAQVVVSFDAMCSYCRKIPERWLKMHPELVHLACRMRWVIPVCHCRNHIASCEPLYLYTYKEGVGEFKGETAELVWDTLNAIGPSIRLMTLGSREDTLNSHIGDWNWRKTVGLVRQLFNDIVDLKDRYTKKRGHFLGLWAVYGATAARWTTMDRSPRVDAGRKLHVQSVYSHDSYAKAPTLQSLVEQLRRSDEEFETPAGKKKLRSVAGLLQEGIDLMLVQDRLRRLAKKVSSGEPESKEYKELASERRTLEERLEPFRKEQGKLMAADAASHYTLSLPCHPENQLLCLPSDFNEAERSKFRMTALASKQINLIRGRLFDLIRVLRIDVRTLTAAGDRKVKHARKQVANTRAMSQIREVQSRRDEHLCDYNFYRDVLDTMGCLEEGEWPRLTVADTRKKSTEQGHQPGSSRTEEGALWTDLGHIAGDANSHQEKLDVEQDPDFSLDGFTFGTRLTKMHPHGPPSPKKPEQKGKSTSEKPPREAVVEEIETEDENKTTGTDGTDGWIWGYGSLHHMTADEVKAWEDECKVQFFRGEAEYERVREELEFKHGSFGNAIRFFAARRDSWKLRATKASSDGHKAYAHEKADMWEALRLDGECKFQRCGVSTLIDSSNGKTLAERVKVFREAEEKYFPCDRYANRPVFTDPTVHVAGFRDTREGSEDAKDI
ncbi:hypothetical protein PQX77_015947 [Marasmius sp. AFHP31]|nr:hypothetical protein PQX77_015947 [Marasmius sp. AFHP31]